MTFVSGASKAALVLLAGCAPAGAHQQGIQLDSELVTDDVRLSWHGHDSDTVVEFATEPDGRYTILEFLPRDRHTYEHPDLMPATTFYYRVRPVRGPATKPATVTGQPRMERNEDWLVPTTVPDPRTTPKPGGAPANLRATPVNADGVLLTWTDNATDETGFLIEADSNTDGDGYQVVFVVDPDVNSAGLITDGPATYRVRAYDFGAPSNVVSEQTGG